MRAFPSFRPPLRRGSTLPRVGVVGGVYPVGGCGRVNHPVRGRGLHRGFPCGVRVFSYIGEIRLSTRSGAFVKLYNGTGDFLCKYTKLQNVDISH